MELGKGFRQAFKVSKKAARYRHAETPNERCGNCGMAHWIGQVGLCDKVRGPIARPMVCMYWIPDAR